ncbi:MULTISPECIES: cupin domain-containing protein [unclassified Sphaerochaeta]|jgi:quercetin dioxygenase-like cupin family protein|uniref:cupin domain-containing protein n=1 Tax=unclassified Sphaerochaeta TaxID=2637943 RepID=UPI000B2A9909|nr:MULTISPECIES: cupin domain-containing protein [unclassified Sphaerochaeta]MCK9600092.1 cupin domain-containing protein [Sphaerochaeta sp.]MDX9824148.1 cupin domain-containing protein [Sphaerochaeta sp.]HPE92195.1 cupin domain-containing protein [Sphaerochaeta sp.]
MNTVVFAEHATSESVGEGVSRKILAYNETMMQVEVMFEKGGIGSVHTHPHTQVTYVLEGSFEFTVAGKPVVVNKGDALLFAPNIPHGTVCLQKGAVLDVFTPCREDFLRT